jgi:acetyltransferase-like isoleucine patch superfamily enzyme
VSIVRELVRSRAKERALTRQWVKLWGKRACHLYDLIRAEVRIASLKLRGAKVGALSVIGNIEVEGRYSNLTVGNHSFVGSIDLVLFDTIAIGSFVTINDDVKLLTASHNIKSPHWERIVRPITIEDFSWVAQGAVLLPGVRIGRGAVVGAYSVVRSDVPAGMLAVGNPATLKDLGRRMDFTFDPAKGSALFEAWLGK